jgi:hypothetical protein
MKAASRPFTVSSGSISHPLLDAGSLTFQKKKKKKERLGYEYTNYYVGELME